MKFCEIFMKITFQAYISKLKAIIFINELSLG